MALRPRYPTIYEISTWVWLAELGAQSGQPVDLGSVPAAEWDALAAYGFDAVWLMGVWERSPAGIAIAAQNSGLQADFRRALPDFRPEDNVGSPYCVRRYAVDAHLGGAAGLACARRELAKRGLRLILDFVPNHVAPDHPWVARHPDHFIAGSDDDLRHDPAAFVRTAGRVYACGKDPYFPAWPDVLQLNAFAPALRQAAVATLTDVASQCDGVRCDMAMLFLNDVFARTWGERAGLPPATDYWRDVIPAVRDAHPDFVFIAEAYWGLEWELQQQGFDFCYDKRLYDRLEHGSAEGVRLHLSADLGYQAKLVRFIENHDEPRAAAAFAPAKARATAVVMATLPGARLFHEGQLDGRTVRLPVFLGRRPEESPDQMLRAFYRRLLQGIDHPAFHDGEWRLCACSGWPDNRTCENVLAWCWRAADDRHLIVVNLGDGPAQARVEVPWDDLAGTTWRLTDALAGTDYNRAGDEMARSGLYVDLPGRGCHFFGLHPV
jgi:glycosidase